jgi:putative FmdB family regulatory protein
MTYDYSCNCCGFYWADVTQSINDDPKKNCPKCKHDTLERVLFPPLVFVRGEPTTLGQLAELNSKKFGKYGLAEREESVDRSKKRAKQEFDSLNKMTPKQKQEWIENG